MKKKKQEARLSVIITRALRNKFLLKCKKQNSDMSRVTRQFIENYLKNGESK